MQEAQDGCKISHTYLGLIGCFRYIEEMEVGEEALAMGFQRQGSEYQDDGVSNGSPALNDSGYNEELNHSVIGLWTFM